MLVDEAGIPRERVRFSEQSESNWHEILKVADASSRMADLLGAALRRYPLNPELLAVREAYSAAVAGPAQGPAIDLAIVTAMDEELRPVLDLNGGRASWEEFAIGGFIHYRTAFDVEGGPLTAVAGCLHKYGGDPTTSEVGRLGSLRPRMLAMVGICAGWEGKDDLILGDVIVADRAFNPREGKVEGNASHPDVQTHQPPPWLVQQLKNYEGRGDWHREIHAERPADLPRREPKAVVAAFASDVPILAVEQPFREPAGLVRKVRAYDLEVKSFLAAAAEQGIPAFAVKAVSDHGTPKKDDRVHDYAAEAAARWMFAFVRATFRHWPAR